jgi:phosphoglycolate phosphatase-like HAD superfamily hydrolase
VVTGAELAGAQGPLNLALVAWLDGHAHGLPVSILSLNSRRAVMRALERHGLAERVSHVVGREDVNRGKPDPEGMRTLATRHGVEAAAMLLVGDAETDRLCAERAGARFVHVEEIGIDWQQPSSDG